MYMCVIYEMEYIKQNGVWKILKLAFQMHYAYQHPQKLTGQPAAEAPQAQEGGGFSASLSPDIWADYNTQYGSGYIYPFHFKHPVTGKATEEEAHNATLDLKPSPFKPV
jgi:hypothetical protein